MTFISEKFMQISERYWGGQEQGEYQQTVRTVDQETKQKQNKRQEGGEAEEEKDALRLRTCHISGFRRGNRGKQDRKERQAFFSRQKNFL